MHPCYNDFFIHVFITSFGYHVFTTADVVLGPIFLYIIIVTDHVVSGPKYIVIVINH